MPVSETLRPVAKATVYELLQDAGVDVSAWVSRSDPKYCYEWAFIEPEKVAVLCLWFGDLIEEGGHVCERRNLKNMVANVPPPRVATRQRRMRIFEAIVAEAAAEGLPVRVIVCDGSRHELPETAHVSKRSLDSSIWRIEQYNPATGDYVVTRIDVPADDADSGSMHSFSRPVTDDPTFIEGVVYSRRDDIHAPFGGSRQGGISVSAKVRSIFVFTGEEGEQYGYQDSWDEQGLVYTYTGEGQLGDMQLTRGNLAVSNHIREGRSLHLFSKVSRDGGRYRYLGEMQCAGWEYANGPDREGRDRRILKFKLVRLRAIPDASTVGAIESSQSFTELREAAYKDVQGAIDNKTAVRALYERSRDVAIYVLHRANGVCECCCTGAPFVRSDNSPYLEVHHIDRLSDGGLDKPDRVAAICPTCHRRIHCGADGKMYNERLRVTISVVERDREDRFPLRARSEE